MQERDAVLRIIRAEFDEMPGLSLTERQAQKVWNLRPEVCHDALSVLTESGYLLRTRSGTFVRIGRPSPITAGLPLSRAKGVA